MQKDEITEAQELRIQTNKNLRTLMILSLLLVAAVCYVQILGRSLLILTSLILFLAFSIWAGVSDLSFPFLLFFLPWSPLLKLYQGSISFYTIAMLICCLITLVKSHFQIRKYQYILTVLIFNITLIAKILQGNGFSNSYLFFFAMLMLFPCIANNDIQKCDFWYMTLFFSIGIISAALSAQHMAGYANISEYIKVDSYLTITRLSGYFGDSNFYSAHITACLGGVQLLLITEQERGRRIILLTLEVILIYCGLLSASKSFVFVFAFMFIVWVPLIIERSGQKSGRWQLLLGLICAALIIIVSPEFQKLFSILDDRFAYSANISQLTTGRSNLWIRYIDAFMHDPILTLFGEGYSNVNLGGRSSHNTIIQGIYQFGVLGFPLLLTWVGLTTKNVLSEAINKVQWKMVILLYSGVVLPWLGLDILFFDEFFLLPFYAAVGVVYASSSIFADRENTLDLLELKTP